MRTCLVALLLLGICPALPAVSPAPPGDDKKDTTSENPAHKDLRKLREDLIDTIDKLGSKDEGAMDKLLTYLDDDVIVTYMDGTTVYKPEGVKKYFDDKMKGDKAIVKHYKPKDVKIPQLTHLYGDTGVVAGTSTDHFDLTDGRQFDIPVTWTATVVKKGDKWKLAGFHSSADVFHNPIKDLEVQRATYMWGGIGAGAGLLLGIILTALLKGRKA